MVAHRFLMTLLIALCATAPLTAESITDPRQALAELGETQGPALWERLVELAADQEVVTAAEAIVGDDERPPAMRLGARWVRHRAADDTWPSETVQALEYLLDESGMFSSSTGLTNPRAPHRGFLNGFDKLPPSIADLEGSVAGDALMLLAALHDPSPENEASALTNLDPILKPFTSEYPYERKYNSTYPASYASIVIHQLVNRQRDAVLDYVIMRELGDVPRYYHDMYQDMCLSYIVYHRVQMETMVPRLVAWAEHGGGLVSMGRAYDALALIGGDRAFESLFAGIRSEDEDRAIEAIGAMRYAREVSPAIRTRLEALAADDEEPRRQRTAKRALRSLDRDRQADEEIPRPHWFRYLRPDYDEDPAAVLEAFKNPPEPGPFSQPWKQKGDDHPEHGMHEGRIEAPSLPQTGNDHEEQNGGE